MTIDSGANIRKVRRLGVAAAVVDGVILPGDVEITGGLVSGVGLSPAGSTGLAIAGFVDLQVNGYGGSTFGDCGVEEIASIQAAMARHGTTHFLATVTTRPLSAYPSAVESISEAMARSGEDGVVRAEILGIHWEGPFLSRLRRGVHPEADIRDSDLAVGAGWIDHPAVRMVTLAPEIPGAFALIGHLVNRGVTVSLGHTDADAECAEAAADAGATAHTHVWNAHRPLTSRDPGSGGVALSRPSVVPCFIADLVHISSHTLALSFAATADRYVVVSDVSSAAGVVPGEITLGSVPDQIGDDAIRLTDGTLAGSAWLLDRSLRNLIAIGRPLPEAVSAITSRPARLIGRSDLGRLRVGQSADVVVLDDHFDVAQVFVGGRVVAR